MEIAPLTQNDWVQMSAIAAHAWVFALCLVIAAASYLLAHSMAPSLVYTGDLDPRVGAIIRLLVYPAVVAFGLLAIVVLVKGALLGLEVLPDIYPRMFV
ncbi:MAG: hypothetical protein OXG77_09695 [Chloroflexi bacterium]|nr:hypothetical protein [Chloroflexota bacterium]MXW28292.1 hypothetical protein [Chloroflexota bacterium]MXX65953.1 hypothetical protein [Chloroflexota bacterium]